MIDSPFTLIVTDPLTQAHPLTIVGESCEDCKNRLGMVLERWLTRAAMLGTTSRSEKFVKFSKWTYSIRQLGSVIEQGAVGELPLMGPRP
jgi:hypothetical protein